MLFEQVQRVILAKKYFGVRCTLSFKLSFSTKAYKRVPSKNIKSSPSIDKAHNKEGGSSNTLACFLQGAHEWAHE